MGWQPTAEQKRNYEERGYFTVENVIPRQTAIGDAGRDQERYHDTGDGRHQSRR